MAMIAHKCPRYRVTIVDINSDRIAQWNSDRLPIYEPGLDEIVLAARGKNLFFSTEIEKGIRESDIIFVSVNTPTKTFWVGDGMAADLQHWEKTVRAMERILCSAQNGVRFEVLSNPEFLAEGTAIQYLEHPDSTRFRASASVCSALHSRPIPAIRGTARRFISQGA
jgi:UDPglucose 6-dehydrogenase